MKKILAIIISVILVLILINTLQPKPKYIYVTQENIKDVKNGGVSMELWCYNEYSPKHIKKHYLETITIYSPNPYEIKRFKSTQCRQTPNLY